MARNTHFRFKRFTIHQDRCAMKVCTDACVLGAWAEVGSARRILDIGAGTGLLSLMAAQRNPTARITAVELDAEATQQARENVATSPYFNQITLIQSAIQDYQPEGLYDSIITNPPFFQSDLRSPDAGINHAHHAQTLHLSDLLVAVDRLLSRTGVWNVLLPVDESGILQQKAEVLGWVPYRQQGLTHQPGRRPFRILTTYGRTQSPAVTNRPVELFIYENDGKTYTSEFRALLKDFYLVF